jgi:hypothetical protein
MPASASVMTADKVAVAAESAPRLSVSLVGRFGLRFNGRPVELRTRKAAAVLGYLALSETKQESRERLVGLPGVVRRREGARLVAAGRA